MKSKIIAISGNMGSGKTTLARALQKDMKATLLCWDDFDDISTGPDDYVEWYHRGEDYNEWDYKELANTLKSLKGNQSILHPVFNQLLNPAEYIIFDAPLGRLHHQTGQHIDYCFHINIPLDISLCRHLIRDFKNSNKSKEELLEELEYYLTHSRPLFIDDDFKASADLVIDGMLTTEQQIQKIREYLQDKQ